MKKESIYTSISNIDDVLKTFDEILAEGIPLNEVLDLPYLEYREIRKSKSDDSLKNVITQIKEEIGL
jgi:hypothetical protein